MPITGTKHPPRYLPDYFESLTELDDWIANKGGLFPVPPPVRYIPRRLRPGDEGKGKLLVAHDFQGGYTESLFQKSYTFNWWHATSIFNYFAHHRISIPPAEWITAAHRQGVPILGTIIFEGSSAADLLRMVAGKPPPTDDGTGYETALVSSYYAKVLANLAKDRGFDGWLLNIEIDMPGGPTEARGLAAWLTIFQGEITKAIGPHGKLLMYDSVTSKGSLSWQERVNSRNLPFFLGSGGLFTNYEWWNTFPKMEADYFRTLDPKYLQRNQYHLGKTLQDVYTGVDLFGRQSHGDGGFGTYKAIEHLDPQGSPGLSVALFAPGWTWEPTVKNLGWNWNQWWEYDTKLWVGPPSGTVQVLQHFYKPNEFHCEHGPFRPLTDFFPTLPPPDPLSLAFYTTFNPGVGNKWFVEGKKVFTSEEGWMDMHKQTSIGDQVWPRPKVYDDRGRQDDSIETAASIISEDAWNGGNSLQIHIALPNAPSAFWIPIQSFSLTAGALYEASVVYKTGSSNASFGAAIRSPEGQHISNITSTSTTDLAWAWQKTILVFEVDQGLSPHPTVPSAIGLTISTRTSTSSSANPVHLYFLVGQISVYPHLPREYQDFQASLFWLAFLANTTNSSMVGGTLEWEVGATLGHVPDFELLGRDDPGLSWPVQPSNQAWFPEFLYFNVYALYEPQDKGAVPWVGGIEEMKVTWLGTTGYGGETDRFVLLEDNLSSELRTKNLVFQIEGVLETGEVVRWNKTTSPFEKPELAVESPQAQPKSESANKTHTVLSEAQMGPGGGQLPYSLIALVCIVVYLFFTSIVYRIYRLRLERKQRRFALDL